MANYTVGAGEIGAHAKTLTPNTVDTVVFDDDLAYVEVVSDGAADLYFTVDGAPAPTVGAAGAHYMPALPCSRVVQSIGDGGTTVRLISTGSVKYSVAQGSGN